MRQSAVQHNLRQISIRVLRNNYAVHVVFWLAALMILYFTDEGTGSSAFRLGSEFINILFYACIAYFNVNYLIPNYLSKKRFWQYSVLLIGGVLVLSPIKMMVFYWRFSEFPFMQGFIIENQHYYFLSMFVFAGATTIVKIIADWLQYIREKQVLQTQTMQSELRFLKSQINPHFLFNTLNNLYALALKKDDRAPEIVIKLSEMMRYMLYECNEKKVLLEKEVNYVRNYLDLERIRQGKNVDILFEVNGPLREQRIAPLIFIPFLENSFKHGLNQVIERGFVEIKLDVQDTDLHFFIKNSKSPNLPAQEHRKSGGIGLVNVKRRLNLMYPNRHNLDIDNGLNTYSIDLKMQLN